MWFVRLICAPFKAIAVIFNGILLLGKGIKASAPYIEEGLNNTNKFLDEVNAELDKCIKEQELERKMLTHKELDSAHELIAFKNKIKAKDKEQ